MITSCRPFLTRRAVGMAVVAFAARRGRLRAHVDVGGDPDPPRPGSAGRPCPGCTTCLLALAVPAP